MKTDKTGRETVMSQKIVSILQKRQYNTVPDETKNKKNRKEKIRFIIQIRYSIRKRILISSRFFINPKGKKSCPAAENLWKCRTDQRPLHPLAKVCTNDRRIGL